QANLAPDGAREGVKPGQSVVHVRIIYRQVRRKTSDLVRISTCSVLDQRADVVAVELLAPVQELELDHEREADDLSAELLHEVDLRLRRPPGGEKIVVDEDARSVLDRIRVQ